jgi:VanZ family protein
LPLLPSLTKPALSKRPPQPVQSPRVPFIGAFKRLLPLICLTVLVIILVAGLWPFNPNPANQVHWMPATPGVHINSPGFLYSHDDIMSLFSTGGISLELWLSPAEEPNNRLPYLLSLWDGKRQEVFLLGQWKDGLAIRVRSRNPKAMRGYRERGCSAILGKGKEVLLTLTSSPEGTVVFLQGKRVKDIPGFYLFEDRTERQGRIIVGNSGDGRHSWEGRIKGLALYNQALSPEEAARHFVGWQGRDLHKLKSAPGLVALYPFTEGRGPWVADFTGKTAPFYKPEFFHPLQKVILEWPGKESLQRIGFYEDMAVNILGFIPLGFFLALWLVNFTRLTPACILFLTFLCGSLLSLAIELSQVFLPGRDSSASDFVFNIVGTIIGIFLFRRTIFNTERSNQPQYPTNPRNSSNPVNRFFFSFF